MHGKDGGPQSGPVYEEVRQRKKEVKAYVCSCRAREERERLQERDRLFRNHDERCFSIPRHTSSCRKLARDGKVITDTHELMECWVDHFSKLLSSQLTSDDSIGMERY